MQQILQEFINKVKSDIPGLYAASVTEVNTGNSYASFSISKDFDPIFASAYNVEAIRGKKKILKALELDDTLKKITFTLEDQIHIIDISKSGVFFVYLVLEAKKSNLAVTELLVKKFKKELDKIL